MKNSFWSNVGVSSKIKIIKGNTLTEAVKVAYESNIYSYNKSRWFVDIKNRFRIFIFKGTKYIVKKTNKKKADLEIFNAKKIHTKVGGKKIGSKIIKIIIPVKITISPESRECYLISQYLGPDMNNNTYIDMSPNLSQKEFVSIIKLFLKNGIVYMGFLPRNVIERGKEIFCFDLEDVTFPNPGTQKTFYHLWKTNILLNWSYFYNFTNLNKKIEKILESNKSINESHLLKYENRFEIITGVRLSTYFLRELINKIVLGSGLPLEKKYNDFYIHPNDICHSVIDVFSSDVDVLCDILFFSFRIDNEDKYFYNLKLITFILVEYYKKQVVQNSTPIFPLDYYLLIPILLTLDEYISEDSYKYILSSCSLDDLILKVIKETSNSSITNLYLKRKKRFMILLKSKIKTRITQTLSITKTKTQRRMKKGSLINHLVSIYNSKPTNKPNKL